MVEASNPANIAEDLSMTSEAAKSDETMQDEYCETEVVIKPRTNFTNNALRRAVPQTNLNKKRENLTQSMINIYQSGQQRLFKSTTVATQQKRQKIQSCSLVAKQVMFSSPHHKEIEKAVRIHSHVMRQPSQILECDSEGDSSDKSDETSSSDTSSDGSSIDAAINGEVEDDEQALYERVLA